MSVSGVSTLGVKFGWAVEATAGTRPTAYTWVPRCNNVGAYAMNEQPIDSSALEDYMTRYIPGRKDGGGTLPISFNRTDEVVNGLTAMIAAYETAKESGKGFWWEIWSPDLSKAEFYKGAPPSSLPGNEKSQNSLQVMELNFIVEDAATEDAVEPTAGT